MGCSVDNECAMKRDVDDKLIANLKVVDYLLLRIIDLCFRYYQWRIERFVGASNRAQRRKVWQNLVKSHFLIKSKMILGYQDAKHSLECADLCQTAEEIVNPESDVNVGVNLG